MYLDCMSIALYQGNVAHPLKYALNTISLQDIIYQGVHLHCSRRHSTKESNGFDFLLGYNIQNLRVMSEPLASVSTAQIDFFPGALDITLLVVALVSTLISLLIPCLYYIKKECREHPTVLIANISLLESVGNFNIMLMAVDIFGYENFLNIKNTFHLLTFGYIHLPSTDENTDFCVYNYCVYMLVELLSISFHICYSVDLLITVKFPFLTGKKRRKYYYAFSVLLPLITLVNSLEEAPQICGNELARESIYKVPLWFLITLLLFCAISLGVVILSFFQLGSKAKIRRDYIRHHRMILCLLVALWIAPIYSNILIRIEQTDSPLFDIMNKASFFCMVGSTGIINIVRISYDSFLRQKILEMISFRGRRKDRISVSEEGYLQVETKKEVNEQIWNLPLSGAMNEFQSQQIVHNIIQVVCEACSAHAPKSSNLRESKLVEESDRSSLYESVYRNTIVVESDQEDVENSFMRMFHKRQEMKYDRMDPNQANLNELKELCKKKRRFNMVCMNAIQHHSEDRLAHKTVHIRSNLKQQSIPQDEINLLLNIKVTSYSHRVFETLRQYDNLTTEQIVETLDLQKNVASIRKAKESLGASGSFFFFSYDHRIVIKTIAEEEKDRFIEILPYYFDHVKYNENSLLARTYGIFSIQIAGISKIYFIMMENTFRDLQQEKIKYQIYDMKGSTVQREEKNPQASVLKDINYFRSNDCFIYLSKANKTTLMDQITKDIDMLKRHNIMDYSLLLGVGKSKRVPKRKELYQKGLRTDRLEGFRYVRDLEEVTRRVYSISLIDYLQQFNFNKKLELWLKRIFRGGGDISSVGTEIYYQRFLNFVRRIVLVFDVKFQGANLVSTV